MNIIQIVTRNELRGAEVFAAQLSDELADRGHRVELVALYGPRPDQQEYLRLRRAHLHELGGRRQGRIELAALNGLRKRLRTFRPDMVQANGFHALKYAVLARRLSGARWPLVYRNISLASGWAASRLKRVWGRWLASHLAAVTSVSQTSARDFCTTYGVPLARARTIRRGIVIPDQLDRGSARRRVREMLGLPPETPLLFHIGGFTPEKNHVGLLSAMNQIVRDVPAAHLVLCGEGPLFSQIAAELPQQGLDQHVHMLGARSDAVDLLKAADVLLLPSHIEGIPGVVLEAAARQVPAVATDVGGTGEFVQQDVTGVLVPAGNMRALADQTVRLLSDPSRLQRLGKEAFDAVKASYAMERTVGEFLELYDEVLAARRVAHERPGMASQPEAGAALPDIGGSIEMPVRSSN